MKKINKALLISSILSGVVAVALTVFYIIYKIQVSGAAYVELATKSILKAYDLLHTTSVIGWCCFGMWILTGILVIALVIIKAVTASKNKNQTQQVPVQQTQQVPVQPTQQVPVQQTQQVPVQQTQTQQNQVQ